jgi:glycosyltransferase involved in cell wall biosynthesis
MSGIGDPGTGPFCRRLLAAIGDANDPLPWSGIPYHFLQAAKASGLLDDGLPLRADGLEWRLRRWVWNAARVASGDRAGGYQYSVPFLEALWARPRDRLRGPLVINCFQLYAPSVVADPSVARWFFIDQTLLQLFDYYGLRSSIGKRIAREAVERERQGYHSAAGVVVHSHWAARSVVEDYGVPVERVHVITPGANLDAASYARWEKRETEGWGSRATPAEDPVRFVFVGKEWKRKGLDRLLRGLALARRQGCHATLRVIGCERQSLPRSLREASGVEWCGFVDKRRDPDRLLRLVAECDVGCLLSRAEAGGIAVREYHALGLAVLGTTAGGSTDHACPRASWLLDPGAPDEAVAHEIREISEHRERLVLARAEAWRSRHSFLYPTTVRRIAALIDGVAQAAVSARG